MDGFIYMAFYPLPVAILVFLISYFGLRKRNNYKLSSTEIIIGFVLLWVISAILILVFQIIIAGQVEFQFMEHLGPLLVGIIIGREYFDWRRNVNTKKRSQITDIN